MNQYDFIFAGGGLAGLSLAYHLMHSSLRGCSMLMIDKHTKQRNDRTWCFWTNQPTLFDEIVSREWNRLEFIGENFQKEIALHDYRYKMIRGIDLYHFAHQRLSALPNVEFLQGNVEGIQDGEEHASVIVDGQRLAGHWVFDSRFNIAQFKPDQTRYHALRQYFKGREGRT